MAIGPRYPLEIEVPKHRVPEQWDHVVCTDYEDHGTSHVSEHSYMVCRRCEKLKRFYASHCHNCREFYLMVFQHPAWNPRINLCWKCIQGESRQENMPDGYWPYHKTVPPLDKFLIPRRLKTPEEKAAELDDLLSFEF